MTFPGKVGAVIPAAGSAERFGQKKQFKQIGRRPLLYMTLTPFLECERIAEIVVVVPLEDVERVDREIKSLAGTKSVQLVPGGERRQDSVQNGVNTLSADCDLICVHDSARPFVTEELIMKSIYGCKDYDGCVLAEKATDTIKRVNDGEIKETLNRDAIWLAQTPQTFRREILVRALETARLNQVLGTDESALVEQIGGKVTVIEGSSKNRKITNPEDWALLEADAVD